uniref:Uncharacterized protein n=1 Tax=Vitrella brassicaformis TaxID=1169539 RepID=A0A7S1KEJ7_9ALVE
MGEGSNEDGLIERQRLADRLKRPDLYLHQTKTLGALGVSKADYKRNLLRSQHGNIVPPIHPDEAMQMVSEVAEQADGSLSRPGGGWGEVFGPSVATAPSVTPPATQPAPMDTQAGGHTSAPPRSAGKVNSEDKSPQSASSGQPIKQDDPQPPSSPHAPRQAKAKADHTAGVKKEDAKKKKKRVKGDKDKDRAAAGGTRTSSGNGNGGTAKPGTQQQQDSDDDVLPRSTKRGGSGRRGARAASKRDKDVTDEEGEGDDTCVKGENGADASCVKRDKAEGGEAPAVKEEPTAADIGNEGKGSPSVAVTVTPPPAPWSEAAVLEQMGTYRERLTQLHGAESYNECLSVLGEVESLCGRTDTNLLISPLQTSNLGPTLGKHLKKSPNPQVASRAASIVKALKERITAIQTIQTAPAPPAPSKPPPTPSTPAMSTPSTHAFTPSPPYPLPPPTPMQTRGNA